MKADIASILEELENLQEEIEEEDYGPDGDIEWEPSLSPTQYEMFHDPSPYILAYGERGTGKTYCLGGHKLVRHLYENFNALALVIVGVKSQATLGGVWHKLKTEILPEWAEGLDIEVCEERRDEQKNIYIDVENRFGGYSRVVCISCPFGAVLKNRIRGFEASYIFVDELTTLDTSDYFDACIQQVGRRPGINGPQQYTAACNPDGPSHWVYVRFFEMPYAESIDHDTGEVKSPEGEWNDDYSVYHLKIEENKHNLPPGYYDRVMAGVAGDPIEYQRMVEGKWIDRPLGEAIFRPYFHRSLHVFGDKRTRLHPHPEFPIICGWDPGTVNNAIIFLQCLIGRDKMLWTCFDEMVWTNEKMAYPKMVTLVMRRMKYWNDKMNTKFTYRHVSDNSAFNQFRAKTGSYDVQDIEQISREKCATFGLEPIKMWRAPKFAGSVEGRVRLMAAKLQQDEFIVDSHCVKMIAMFEKMVSEKERDGKYEPEMAFKPKRSIYIHPFDAATYPMMELSATGRMPTQNEASRRGVKIVEVGS